ncbi:MAG: hypothetical protein R3316_08330 [Rhodovibrionaceae bacterium]|nr:hypothetical protein [Rhodovibrionaceae bacterium]
MIVHVECYAGHRGETEPRRFFIGPRLVEVADILDRWLAPDHAYFKIRAADGNIYILRRDVAAGVWELWMYDRSGPCV